MVARTLEMWIDWPLWKVAAVKRNLFSDHRFWGGRIHFFFYSFHSLFSFFFSFSKKRSYLDFMHPAVVFLPKVLQQRAHYGVALGTRHLLEAPDTVRRGRRGAAKRFIVHARGQGRCWETVSGTFRLGVDTPAVGRGRTAVWTRVVGTPGCGTVCPWPRGGSRGRGRQAGSSPGRRRGGHSETLVQRFLDYVFPHGNTGNSNFFFLLPFSHSSSSFLVLGREAEDF